VVKRYAEKGAMTLPGRKVIGTWTAIGANRVFRLVEIEDHKALVLESAAWRDLVNMEAIPVMESGELMKVISGK